MAKILILVEGQTEEKFVRVVLNQHLNKINVDASPTLVGKGGVSTYNQIRRDLFPLLGDTSAAAVTTMIDYYGPVKFPGCTKIKGKDCYEKVEYVEKAFSDDIQHEKFIPFLQLHEFEGLLFSSPVSIANRFERSGTLKHKNLVKRLKKIRDMFVTPEEINNNTATCPSRRLIKLIPQYRKVLDGTLISKKMGLNTIRKECPHFNEWLERLEAFGS